MMPSRRNRRSRSNYLDNRRHNRKTSSTALKAIGYGAAAASLVAGGYYLYQSGQLQKPIHKAITALSKIRDNPLNDIGIGLRGAVVGAKDAATRSELPKIADDFFNMQYRNMQRQMGFTERMKNSWTQTLKAARDFTKLAKPEIQASLKAGATRRGALKGLVSPAVIHGPTQIESVINEAKQVQEDMAREINKLGTIDPTLNVGNIEAHTKFNANKIMQAEFFKIFTDDPSAAVQSVKRTGTRPALVKDLMPHQNAFDARFTPKPGDTVIPEVVGARWFNPMFMSNLKKMGTDMDKLMNLKVDENILIDAAGNILDLRGASQQVNRFLSSLSNEFQVPFVGLNPFKMFQADRLFAKAGPTFKVLETGIAQPLLTFGQKKLSTPLLFSNGSVIDFWNGQTNVLATDGYLVNAGRGMVAPALRKMSGIPMAEMTPPGPNASWCHKTRYALGKKFSIGLQDQPLGFFSPTDPLSSLYEGSRAIESRFPAYGTKTTTPFYAAFGGTKEDPGLIFVKKFKGLSKFPGQSGGTDYGAFLKQFFAGRENLQDVTTASFIPYIFFERMNATLNLAGLGFSIDELGSAGQIFKSYFTKRIFPIMGGIAAVKYIDYEAEKLLGKAPSHMIAGAYADASIGFASIRDFTGITALGKKMDRVMPGFEQLYEIPGLGFLDATKNRHEMAEFWESGEVVRRKGRYWPYGNTPYSGGRVEGHEPNWVRKVRSDWQYTDTLHGSKDEYWRNAAIPTPRYPLAPIRRFVTDPYRMEMKHYRDRPYLITGGIPELEELPLIGPLANATIGRILKPQKKMHPEVWEQLEGSRPSSFTTLSSNQPINPLPKAYDKDWHHKRLNTGAAYNQVMGSNPQEVVVAVLDTGIDESHPALSGITYRGVNTSGMGSRGDYTDRQGHGTHVAGIISAQGGDPKSTAGMAPPAIKILPIKVLDDRGMGSKESIIEGMKYARQWRGPQGQRVSVVNMSLGAAGQFYDEDYWSEMQNLYESGILPVVASGNAGIPQVGTPAFYPDAMSVGATTPNDRRAWFSQYGEQLDIVAPGTNIRSTVPGGYQKMSGTSMATPIVAATAAMLKAQQPDLSAAELRFILQATAEDIGSPGWDPEHGSGLVSPTFATRIASNKDANTKKLIQFGGKVMDDDIATERRLLLEQLQATVPAKMAYVERQGIVHEGRTYNMPGTARNVAYKTWHSITELGGFYGFSMRLATGDNRDEGHLIAEARAMTSYRRSFWDAQIGGLGGDANEIIRRFTSKPEKWADRYNPVPNTMPSWMPGEDYMVNFKIGDPYIKIPDGEIRLPGEAYESVHRVQAVEEAMQDPDIRKAIESGQVHRGEFYDPLTRMRILADVAPWSQEYKIAAKQVSDSNLSDEESKEAREIRTRLSERKEPMRLYDRKFDHANVENQTARIIRVIDPNTFMVEGIDNPIRLAGVKVATGKENPDRIEAEKFLNKYLYRGARVRIAYDANIETRINQDTYRTISSVVYSNGMNLNKELINRGLGVEKDQDNSPAGIHARFSNSEIAAGRAWESFSHLDTAFHTKFLQVRSPLEGYKRRDLYGKDFQNWKSPIKDFIVPSYESFVSKGIIGIPAAMVFGSFFGRASSPYAKLIGATVAGTAVSLGILNKVAYEAIHKEKWIPRRRRKEREIEEYIDALKYVKSLKMYREYAGQARKEEGINVQKEILKAEEHNERRTSAKRTLEDIKRQLHNGEPGRELVRDINRELKEKGFDYIRDDDQKALMKKINWNIRRLTSPIRPELHGPLAQKAYSYYEESKQTMQGFKPGSNMQDAMAALPKKDRKYLPYFMDAPAEDREEILASVPQYTRRVLQSIWGQETDEQKDLEEYFTKYQLPDEYWEGWEEYSNLENVKVKIVKNEAMDYSEFNIWPNDINRAEADPIRAPEMRTEERASTVRRRLEEILQGAGLEDVEIDVSYNSSNRFALDFEIEKDRRKELQQRMNELRKDLA